MSRLMLLVFPSYKNITCNECFGVKWDILCCFKRQVYTWPMTSMINRGATGKLFWGVKVIFSDFFPGMKCFFLVENFHFGRPKQILVILESEKQKEKKKKEKKVFSSLWNFLLLPFSISSFPFTIFLLFFSIFPLFHFFFASFFPVGEQKFPGQKSLGGTLPPCPHLLCYWWLTSWTLQKNIVLVLFQLHSEICLQVDTIDWVIAIC